MVELEYLMGKNGQLKAVVIPIEVWKNLFVQDETSADELAEAIEDYCLGKAMDEAEGGPLLTREEALAYLEE
jgi:hypothetical protein